MKINWKEVCKFLSGGLFAGVVIKIYFYFYHIPLPFFGYTTISPELLGIGSLVQFILFLIFFYFGYLKKES